MLDLITRPSKVAVVLPKLSRFDIDNPTSIDSVVRQLVENSSLLGCHVVFRPPTKNPVTSIPTKEFSHSNPLLWKTRLKKAISSIAPVCIEVHQSIYLADYMARNFSHLPVILFRHNLVDRPGGELKKKKYFNKLKRVACFIFVSEFSANHFKLNWPEFSDRVHVVPNIVSEQAWFNPPNAERRQKIIYMGRPLAVKGFQEFCEGMVPVLQNHQDWRAQILIYEWERHKKYAQQIIGRLNRSTKKVDLFIDRPLQKVQHLVKEAQIVVVPSKWEEPFGLVALEAHLAGVAVVSSGRGGLTEISGKSAYYLDEVTPEAIANAVSALITNPTLRRQMQYSGQRRCMDLFKPSKIITLYDNIKKALINEH